MIAAVPLEASVHAASDRDDRRRRGSQDDTRPRGTALDMGPAATSLSLVALFAALWVRARRRRSAQP